MLKPAPIVRSTMIDGCVLSNTALTPRLYSLRIETQLLPFEAGQFVRLQLTVANEKIAKPYSLVNTPDQKVAEIFFNTVPNGQLSLALANLQAGDPVAISQPATGFFTLSNTPPAQDLWLFATGTGLGPYLSILRTPTLWESYEQVVLTHGVPLREELVYRELLDQVKREHPERFQYHCCVSREDNPGGMRGRITDAIDSGELEQRTGLKISATDSAVMLCGNHNMITDVQALLAQRDMHKHQRHKPGQIVIEQYF